MHSAKLLAFSLLGAMPLAAQQVITTVYGPQAGGNTGERVEPGGDLDGDQVPDFIVVSSNIGSGLLQVVSGASLVPRNLVSPSGSSISTVVATPDMNLDGVRDLIVNRGGTLYAYSGATLALLWQSVGVAFHASAPIGDVDNDGRSDVAALSYFSGNTSLWTLRGSNGSGMASMVIGSFVHNVIGIGDINGDGKPEIATSGVQVYQAAPLGPLLNIPFGGIGLAAANLAGDARNEILAADGSSVRVLSASTGAVLLTIPGGANSEFAVMGDLDADGVPDLALRSAPGSLGDGVDFHSGATGSLLSIWRGTARFRCVELAGVGDVNGDGFGDLVIGDSIASLNPPSQGPGAWQLLSGKVLATMQSQPTQCAQGPFLPQLGVTRPRLGYTAIIEGRDAPLGTVGFLAFSPQPTGATNLGVLGCDAWFDMANGSLLYQPATVQWTYQFPVPLAPQLAGYAFALQAFYAPTFSPIGIDVSNGIWARFGF